MNYFLDTEFHEYSRKPFIGKAINTIELISIGMVDELDREYYAISKDFDLKAAWDNEWIRDNVLESIHKELCQKVGSYGKMFHHELFSTFSFKSMKRLLKWYGKDRWQIRREIVEFIYPKLKSSIPSVLNGMPPMIGKIDKDAQGFYAYFADYDWVVFCWIFGKMIELPYGFPMFCMDLKQMMEERKLSNDWKKSNCPSPVGEHNALVDAQWNRRLYEEIIDHKIG